MPRPTKWTRELQKQICTSLATGAYVETAAAIHGVSKVTLYDWFKRGNAGEEPYVGFLNAIKSAEAESEQLALTRISTAAEDPKNWTAAAWRLERKHPDRWGRRDKVDLSIDGEVEQVHRFEPDATFMAHVVQNLSELKLPEAETPILLDMPKTLDEATTSDDDLAEDSDIEEYDAESGVVRPVTPPPGLGVVKLPDRNGSR